MIDTKEAPTDQDVLDQLETRRAELREWHAKESEYSTAGLAAKKQRQALDDEANKLIRQNPLLIDGDGEGVGKDNPVTKLRREFDKAPDPDRIFRRRDHAKQVCEKLGRDLEAFVLENFEAIHAARYPQAVEARDQVTKHRDAFLAATENYLQFARETTALCAPHQDFDGRSVAGIDEASDLARVLERVEHLPLPTINGTGPEVGSKPQAVLVERPTEDEGNQ